MKNKKQVINIGTNLIMSVLIGGCYAAINYFIYRIEPSMSTILLICLIMFVISSVDNLNSYLNNKNQDA